MNTDEILLAAYFRKQTEHSHEKFLVALTELRQGTPLTYWLSQSQVHCWRQNLNGQLLKGIRFIYPGHDFYPDCLLRMEIPPILLSYLGSPVWMSGLGLAVVGSRNPSRDGLRWLEESLPAFFAQQSVFIVSGGARGIDQKAHALSLQSGVPTVAMLPSGLGAIYPADLKDWVQSIVQGGGAVVSEYPYHQEIRKHYFLARNRLIAGLGIATILVEAGRRSGTLITARQCLDQGRPLWVVPSHPLDARARGGLDLVIEGATLLKDAEDLNIFFRGEVQSLSHFTTRSISV